jgi:hypothetical protein
MANPIKVIKGIVRVVGGISGKGGKNVQPVYRETGNSVKVIKPGTKDLTFPTKPMTSGDRPYSDIRRMRGTHPGYKP